MTTKAPTGVQYFVRDQFGPTLMRRDGGTDQAWAGDHWQPTNAIAAYMTGNDDWVEEITAAEAERRFPDAVDAG